MGGKLCGLPGAAHPEPAVEPGFGARHGRQQQLGVHVQGGLEHGFRGAVLDDPAAVHHVDLVRDVARAREVVRDVEEGDLLALLELADEVEDPEPDRHVEHRDRLVREHDLRLDGKRAGDRHALALTARQLVRVLPGHVGGGHEANRLEEVAERDRSTWSSGTTRWIRSGRARWWPTRLTGFSEANGSWKINCTWDAVPAQRATAAEARDVLVLEQDRARRRLVQLAEQPSDGALAAPALAHERRDGSGPEREAHVVHRTQHLARAPEARPDGERATQRRASSTGGETLAALTTAPGGSGRRSSAPTGPALGAPASRRDTAAAALRGTADGTGSPGAGPAGRAGSRGSRSSPSARP